MNFNFTEEQLQFKNTVKSFLVDECSPDSIRDGWAAKKSFNHDRWNKIADLGVLSSNLPEKERRKIGFREGAKSLAKKWVKNNASKANPFN